MPLTSSVISFISRSVGQIFAFLRSFLEHCWTIHSGYDHDSVRYCESVFSSPIGWLDRIEAVWRLYRVYESLSRRLLWAN